MASCNAEVNSSDDKNEKEIPTTVHNLSNEDNVPDRHTTNGTFLTDNTSSRSGISSQPTIKNSSHSVLTESNSNVELKILKQRVSPSKKRKKKRMRDSQSDPPGEISSIKKNSVERDPQLVSAVVCSNMADLKTEKPSEMIPAIKSSPPVVTDSLSNVVRSSQTKKRKKRRKRKLRDTQSDPAGDIPSINNSSLEMDLCLEPDVVNSTNADLKAIQPSEMNAVNSVSQSVFTDSPCNVELGSSLTEKRNKTQKRMQDALVDLPGNSSSIKNSPINRDLCLESEIDNCTNTDLRTVQSSQLSSSHEDGKKKQKKEHNTVVVNVKDCVLDVASTSLMEKSTSEPQPLSDSPARASAGLMNYDKDLAPLEVSSTGLIGKNILLCEQQSSSPTNRSFSLEGKSTLTSEEHSGCPRHESSSLMNECDKVSKDGLASDKNEKVLAFLRDEGVLREYHKRNSPETLDTNVEPTMSKSDNVHNCDVSATRLETVQDRVLVESSENAANDFAEMGSCSFSNGGSGGEENAKMTNSDGSIKVENNPQVHHFSLRGSHTSCNNKKLLILDINGLLADIIPYFPCGPRPDFRVSKKSVFKRPFCDDFLQFCFEKFDVGVWSSRTKRNVDMVIDYLLGHSKDRLLFCWDQSHCTKTGFNTVENKDKPLLLKELKKLWEHLNSNLTGNKVKYDESSTLLLDDSPYKALNNPAYNCIFPRSYLYRDKGDSSLGPRGDLRVYLERLADAPNVQEFVAQNPFGQRAITKSNPSWGFYNKIISDLGC